MPAYVDPRSSPPLLFDILPLSTFSFIGAFMCRNNVLRMQGYWKFVGYTKSSLKAASTTEALWYRMRWINLTLPHVKTIYAPFIHTVSYMSPGWSILVSSENDTLIQNMADHTSQSSDFLRSQSEASFRHITSYVDSTFLSPFDFHLFSLLAS